MGCCTSNHCVTLHCIFLPVVITVSFPFFSFSLSHQHPLFSLILTTFLFLRYPFLVLVTTGSVRLVYIYNGVWAFEAGSQDGAFIFFLSSAVHITGNGVYSGA